MIKNYRITEDRFSYCYKAVSESAAIWIWIHETFKSGCYATSIHRDGKFNVMSPEHHKVVSASIREI